jgi:hypothetical protein
MAERSWLFDAANAPKGGQNQMGEYELAKIMGAMASSGIMTVGTVFNSRTTAGSNELSVTWSAGFGNFVTQARQGEAMVAGFFYENTAALSLTHDAPSATSGQDRFDRVVLQLDWNNNTINAVIIKGATGSNPTAPALTRTWGTKWEVPLARVRVRGASTSLSDVDVIDERVPYIPAGLTPGVRLKRASYAITNTTVDLLFDVLDYETMQGMYDNSGVNTKFVAPFPGLYMVSGVCHFGSAGSAGVLAVRIFRSQKFTAAGALTDTVFYHQHEVTNNTSNIFMSVSGVIQLDKGEYVSVSAGQNYTSQVTIDTLSASFTFIGKGTITI